jgi:hypothetical protein
MEADRTETNNLGATTPAKVKALSGLWDARHLAITSLVERRG